MPLDDLTEIQENVICRLCRRVKIELLSSIISRFHQVPGKCARLRLNSFTAQCLRGVQVRFSLKCKDSGHIWQMP